MNNKIPDSHVDLLKGPVYVQLASHMKDGSIQVHPVWCSYEGTYILINSAKGRVKDKNIRLNPSVTVFAGDPCDPERWIEVRGTVAEITEDGADGHLDDLSELYYKERPCRFHKKGVIRVIYKVKPERVVVFAK